jgi:D-hydroxyproline dehydrogenase subunit gamma
MRIESSDIARGEPLAIRVDGQRVVTFAGETLLTAILLARGPALRVDTLGRPRGFYCNMGTCGECTVDVLTATGDRIRLRACLTPVTDGLQVMTRTPPPHE